MEERIVALADFVWGADQLGGAVLLVLLVGTGLYVTLRLGLPQVRHFAHAVALVSGRYDKASDPGEVTHFQALSAALSGTVGIGNIAGVATAIYFGGPGAVFWLWLTAALGMATKLTECTLAVRYREKQEDGSYAGGPMYSIKNGLSKRFRVLAWLFAGFATIASFGIGNMVQANTVAEQVHATTTSLLGWGVPRWSTGLVMAALLALVIVGGIRRIARVASRLVPAMAVLYVLGALVVLVVNWRSVPGAFATIFDAAFNGTAATGGFLGASIIQAVRWGVARGTFSNEAGLGSSPIAHAAARTDEPVREGLVAMLEPFIDTLCICTLTALAILSTGVWHERIDQERPLAGARFHGRPVATEAEAAQRGSHFDGVVRVTHGAVQGTIFFFEGRSTIEDPRVLLRGEGWSGALHVREGRVADALEETIDRGLVRMEPERRAELRLAGSTLASGPTLTALAFGRSFPGGQVLVTLALVLFAFSTAISWSYYGDRCVVFLFGLRAVLPYRVLFTVAHFLGAIFAVRVVWALADVANAAMALPNLLSIWALAGLVAVMRRRYFAGEPPEGEPPPRRAAPRKGKRK